MSMTEAAAREKWCPFARIVGMVDPTNPMVAGTFNRFNNDIGDRPLPCNCIASRCMAWRWKSGTSTSGPKPYDMTGLVEARGHCGLAGKP